MNTFQNYGKANRRRRSWQKFVRFMAMVVVFCTTYALILPAITMESETVCGKPAHVHDSLCYEMQVPECTIPESEGHQHGDDCYSLVSSLVCGLEESEEHKHDAPCFFVELKLTCTTPESWGHSHAEDATDPVLTLICKIEEHTHDESCFPEEAKSTDPAADTAPTPGEPDPTFGTAPKETKEPDPTFGTAPKETEEPDPTFGTAPKETEEPDPTFGTAPKETEASTEASTEEPSEAPTGDATEATSEETTEATSAETTEETSEETTAESSEEATDESTEEPTEDPEETVPLIQTNETEDGTRIQVSLPEDTLVPADAQLQVTDLGGIALFTDQEAQLEEIRQVLPEANSIVSLLDISFYNADGDYVPVSDTAGVTIRYDGDVFGDREARVVHYTDDGAVVIEDVTLSRSVNTAEDGTETVTTLLSFQTDGFSVFAVVTVGSRIEEVTTEPVTGLSGEYYIARVQGTSINAMGSTTATAHNDSSLYGLSISAGVSNPANLSGRTLWRFDPVDADNGIYKISTLVDGVRKYIQISYQDNNRAHIYLVDEASASDCKIQIAPQNANRVVISATSNNRTFYINPFGGIGTATSFNGWYESHGGSELSLYADMGLPATGLGGKTYALVRPIEETVGKAVTTDSTTVNTVAGLKGVDVTMSTMNGNRYVIGNIPVWTFHAVADNPGFYTVSTEVDGQTKYLRLLEQSYQNNNDGRGSLTLDSAENASQIRAVANADGSVLLALPRDDGGVSYINSDQSQDGNFWVYNQKPVNTSSNFLLCELQSASGLVYDLKLPHADNWYNDKVPNLQAISQNVTAEGVALPVPGNANAVGTYDFDSISAKIPNHHVAEWCEDQNDARLAAGTLTKENYLTPGAEYEFLGWEATVDGVTHLFAPGAIARLTESGNIAITDTAGVTVELLPDTILTGKWHMIREIVMFFVNFGDTMLEHQDNHPIVGYGKEYYTLVLAFGHMYNPSPIAPPKNANDKDVILRANDATIQAEFVTAYDPSRSGTQIIITAVKESVSSSFTQVYNYNQIQLEATVGAYLRSITDNRTIKIDGAAVDPSDISAQNYKLYWYLQKSAYDSNDGWHIDGVLVARTHPTKIIKTFSGLTDAEAIAAIEDMEFPMYLMPSATTADSYHTLTAKSSEPGVYTNDGRQYDRNIYQWTLQAIKGQQYAFRETGYQVAGHDVSSLISVHYTDGSVVYKYGTDTTFTATGGMDSYVDKSPGTDLFASKPIVGGQVESVIFANFYTDSGTGMFSISKVRQGNDTERLSGAEFTLTKQGETEPFQTQVTNVNGSAHFDNLPVGTYILTETQAPTGYQRPNTTWTVEVAKDSDDNVTVTIWETGQGTSAALLYDSADGGLKEVYLIRNTPNDDTLTLVKNFSGLKAEDLTKLVANSKPDGTNPFHIKLQRKNDFGAFVDYGTYYLSQAEAIIGTTSYRWNLTGVPSGTYKVTEYNFRYDGYMETVVSIFNNVDKPVNKNDVDFTASTEFDTTSGVDTVTITNHYTNEFQLKIRKVDSSNKTPLAGAKFKIYCLDPKEATGQETIRLPDGRIAYYVGETTASGSDGYATINGLKLSSNDKTYLYVFDEFQTPNGYVKLDEPIISEVKVGTENYSNGVYSLEVENVPEELATVTITATKEWDLPDGWKGTLPDVTLTLYQVLNESVIGTETVTVNAASGWKKVWEGLPYVDNDGNKYQYYVSEAPIAGFYTDYGSQVYTLTVGTDSVSAAIAEGYERSRTVTVINSPGYELPETGSIGTRWMYPIGFLLILAVFGLYWLGTIETKKQRGRS